jgi:hypothetical protein
MLNRIKYLRDIEMLLNVDGMMPCMSFTGK